MLLSITESGITFLRSKGIKAVYGITDVRCDNSVMLPGLEGKIGDAASDSIVWFDSNDGLIRLNSEYSWAVEHSPNGPILIAQSLR